MNKKAKKIIEDTENIWKDTKEEEVKIKNELKELAKNTTKAKELLKESQKIFKRSKRIFREHKKKLKSVEQDLLKLNKIVEETIEYSFEGDYNDN